jgi:hypothetical protein
LILRATCAHRSVYDPVIMDAMRNSWTDERLDDVNRGMENGFNRIDAELRAVHARIDALQRTTIQTSAVMVAALIGLIATQL